MYNISGGDHRYKKYFAYMYLYFRLLTEFDLNPNVAHAELVKAGTSSLSSFCKTFDSDFTHFAQIICVFLKSCSQLRPNSTFAVRLTPAEPKEAILPFRIAP